ncbi:MAG: fimbrillin family protein [Bacteroidales bacterium]
MMLILVTLSSCGENINESISLEESENLSKGFSDVEFEVADSILTKLTTPFGGGRYVTIYAYFHGDPVTNPPVITKYYKSNPKSKLIPVNSPMKLYTGKYDFYAVSTNSTINQTPSFKNGFSTSPLKNGVDYLWAKMENITVKPGKNVVPITFSHQCAQIILNIDESLLTFVFSIDGCTLTVPNDNNKMNLSDGFINTAQTLEKVPMSMKISGQTCKLIVLPYDGRIPIKVVLKLWVNLHWEDKLFTTNIPFIEGGLQPGRTYIYKLIIKDNIFDLIAVQE